LKNYENRELTTRLKNQKLVVCDEIIENGGRHQCLEIDVFSNKAT
jgi:hypothetical protein